MRVGDREYPPKQGEILYCSEARMKYVIEIAHGIIPHNLLGRIVDAYSYTVRWEDTLDHRLALFQMYSDEYLLEDLEGIFGEGI